MSKRAIAAAVLFCCAAMDGSAQALLTKVVQVDCWSPPFNECLIRSGRDGTLTSDWGGAEEFTHPQCQVPPAIPLGATVYEVVARLYASDSNPFDGLTSAVGLSINGVMLGATQALTTATIHCDGTDRFGMYEYGTGFAPGGLSWFGTDATPNVLELAVLNSETAIEAVDLEIKYELPPPFDFDISAQTDPEDRRVLIAKHRSDFTYTSHFQNLIARDREVPIRVRVNDALGPLPGETVYFRVADPPDASPYIPAASRHANDNRDTNDTTSGQLTGTGITPVSGHPGVVSAVTGPTGLVEMTLTVSDEVAGDNYEVEGSFDPTFTCSPFCSKSATLTAWKRVYVEKDEMFRGGAFLAANAAAGQNMVRVRDSATAFHRNDLIRLIHAPFRDGTGPVGVGGVVDLRYWWEDAQIVRVQRDNAPDNPNGRILTLQGNLTNSYYVDQSVFSGSTTNFLNDAVGLRDNSPSRMAFQAGTQYLVPAYEDAYVEYVMLNPLMAAENALPFIPFYRNVPLVQLSLFAGKWIENADHTRYVGGGFPETKTNHQYAVTAANTDEPTHVNPAVVLGRTFNSPGVCVSYTFVESIERACRNHHYAQGIPQQLIYGEDPLEVGAETLVHELTHLWDVNTATGEHCSLQIYPQHPSGGTADCVMHAVSDASSADGIVAFHYVVDSSGNVDSEYRVIREAAEPRP
jgi:hypothetical protein